MAAPLAAIAGKIAKEVIVDLFTDPEKTIKGISLGVILPVMLIVLIFALPVTLIVSIPALLFSGDSSTPPADLAKQLATIAIYSSPIEPINKENLKWIKTQENKYRHYDDIVVKSNFDLTWQHLMAIDSVKLEQDFNKTDIDDVITLAEKFVIRKVTIETYIVQTSAGSVTKRRAIIEISTKPINNVMDEIKFTSLDKEIANNIYRTLVASKNPGGVAGDTSVSGNVLAWKTQIEAAAIKWKVDPALIAAIIHAESGGYAGAMSPVGAIGLMQLMPGTAGDLRVNPFDPNQNIDGGSHYISILLKSYSIEEAIASYNCGPGNVDNGHWVKFTETVNYVARVTGLYQSYKQVFTGG